MKKFRVTGILNTGDSFENHDHKEVFTFLLEGKNAQEVKAELIQRLCLEIQITDRRGKIIPLFKCDNFNESLEIIHLKDSK
jgi:hypothetical protein